MVNWAPPWHHGHSHASAWIQYSNPESFHVLHGTYLTISKFDPPLPTGKVKLCPSMHAVRSSSASTFAQYGHPRHPPSTRGGLSKASQTASTPAGDMQFRRIKGASPSLYDDPAFSSDPCSHPFFKPSDERSLVSARYNRQVEVASPPRRSATPMASTEHDASPIAQGAQLELIPSAAKPNSAKHVTSQQLSTFAPQIQRKRTKLSQLFWHKTSSTDANASQSTSTDRRRTHEVVSRPNLPDPPRGSALIFKYTKRSLSRRRSAAAVAQPNLKLHVIADSPNYTCEVDRVDELDDSNPLGLPIHHSGPYEAIKKLGQKSKFQLQSTVTRKGSEHGAKDHPSEDAQEHVSSSLQVAARDAHDGSLGMSAAGAALPPFASVPGHKTPVSSDAGSSHTESRGRLKRDHSSSPSPSIGKDANCNVRNTPDDVLQPAPEDTALFESKLLTEVLTLHPIPPPVYHSPPRSISSLDQHPERFEQNNDHGTLHAATDEKTPHPVKEERGPNSQPHRGSNQQDKATVKIHPPTRYSNRQRSNVGIGNEPTMPRHRFLPKRLVMPAPLQQSHLQQVYPMHAGGAEILRSARPLGPQPRLRNRQQVPRAQDIPIAEHQKLKKRTSSKGIFSVFSRKKYAVSPDATSSLKPEKPKTLKKRRRLFKF